MCKAEKKNYCEYEPTINEHKFRCGKPDCTSDCRYFEMVHKDSPICRYFNITDTQPECRSISANIQAIECVIDIANQDLEDANDRNAEIELSERLTGICNDKKAGEIRYDGVKLGKLNKDALIGAVYELMRENNYRLESE